MARAMFDPSFQRQASREVSNPASSDKNARRGQFDFIIPMGHYCAFGDTVEKAALWLPSGQMTVLSGHGAIRSKLIPGVVDLYWTSDSAQPERRLFVNGGLAVVTKRATGLTGSALILHTSVPLLLPSTIDLHLIKEVNRLSYAANNADAVTMIPGKQRRDCLRALGEAVDVLREQPGVAFLRPNRECLEPIWPDFLKPRSSYFGDSAILTPNP